MTIPPQLFARLTRAAAEADTQPLMRTHGRWVRSVHRFWLVVGRSLPPTRRPGNADRITSNPEHEQATDDENYLASRGKSSLPPQVAGIGDVNDVAYSEKDTSSDTG
jgi:hypothetical protein